MLTYLFEARLKDGTLIRQTQADVSIRRPAKSAWWDVQQRIDEVEMLLLLKDHGGDAPFPVIASVRMDSGLFYLSGNEFFLSPCGAQSNMLSGGTYRPHYYRRRTQCVDSAGQTWDSATLFCIGWEYVIDGAVHATQMLQIY